MGSQGSAWIAGMPIEQRRFITIAEPRTASASGALEVLKFVASPTVYLFDKAIRAAAKTNGPTVRDGVLHVPAADQSVSFPPGHPIQNVVYVANPVRSTSYETMADFHSVTLREKISDLFLLLAGLRAEEVEIEVTQGGGSSTSGRLGALLPVKVPVQLQATAGVGRSRSEAVKYVAHFDATGHPSVPGGLPWYPMEREWQNLATARLEHGLLDINLTFSYDKTFGVDAGLEATVKGLGLAAGGEFKKFEAESWVIRGRFKKKPLWGW